METSPCETYGILKADYDPTPPGFERNLTTALMRRLFGGIPVALDFGNGDIRPLGRAPARVHFCPPRFGTLISILVNPGLRLGETFMDGKWYLSRGRLFDFLLLVATAKGGALKNHGINLGLTESLVHYYKQFIATFSATREVARHYDVNTDLFKLMIGENLAYSCAFFERDSDDLETAQRRKFDTIFERMRLNEVKRPRILDIGCGWGSFERYFPRNIEAELDGISISEGQISYARTQIENLSDKGRVKVNFHKQDYRYFCEHNAGRYDRVVSIGMLEHVGRSKYAHYFRAIHKVLAPGGLALVHSIVKHQPGSTNLWVDRYIFPGGYAPMISEVVQGIERSGLKISAVHYHDGWNYIKTLRVWLANLLENEDAILKVLQNELDGDQRHREKVARTTYRMFIFYLSAVQLMFHPEYGDDGVAQFIVQKS